MPDDKYFDRDSIEANEANKSNKANDGFKVNESNESKDAQNLNDLVGSSQLPELNDLFLSEELSCFLKLILIMLKQDLAISRVTLAKFSENGPFIRSENQVRRILNQLEDLNLITLNRGRRGVMPTAKAYQWIERIK